MCPDAPTPASDDLPENRQRHHGGSIPGIDISLPDPDMATIIVHIQENRLHFAPSLQTIENSNVTCDDGGNVTVKLKEEAGYTQKIAFISDQNSLTFNSFCIGTECRKTEGPFSQTPFSIEFFTPSERFIGFILTDTYTDKSSLSTFGYTLHYDTQSGPISTLDPQIRNQGTSGPPEDDDPR